MKKTRKRSRKKRGRQGGSPGPGDVEERGTDLSTKRTLGEGLSWGGKSKSKKSTRKRSKKITRKLFRKKRGGQEKLCNNGTKPICWGRGRCTCLPCISRYCKRPSCGPGTGKKC